MNKIDSKKEILSEGDFCEETRLTKKSCKFVPIIDPRVREKIIELTNPPKGATNFIFWETDKNDEYPLGGWGLTLKQMPTSKNKKYPGQHVWKCIWTYNETSKIFETGKQCDSLVNNIVGTSKFIFLYYFRFVRII